MSLFPLTAYAMLVVSAWRGLRLSCARRRSSLAPRALLLLFTGIHNAWDIITYHVFVKRPNKARASSDDEDAGPLCSPGRARLGWCKLGLALLQRSS